MQIRLQIGASSCVGLALALALAVVNLVGVELAAVEPCLALASGLALAVAYLGGVELAVVELQDLQGSLEVCLRLRQLHLDGPQAVDIRGGQVHPQQGQVHLQTAGGSRLCLHLVRVKRFIYGLRFR